MSYALITGASKGIGKEMVYELCKRKSDVLLIARSEDQLKQLREEVQKKYNVKADYFAIDLSKPKAAKEIFDWCNENKFDINILINNAGYGLSGALEKYSLQDHEDMMHVNMHVLVELIYLFLPQLKKQSQSFILNISSTAAYQAVPYLNIYAATKAFVLNFSRGLHYELKDTNVSVTCVCPGGTDTGFASRAKISVNAIKAGEKVNMQPADVAAIAIKSMFKKKKEVITGVINKVGAAMAWLSPKVLSEAVAAKLYKD